MPEKPYCHCPDCDDAQYNPWKPSDLTVEKAVEVHNNLFHDGEDAAEIIE